MERTCASIGQPLLVALICALSCAMSGCLESSFNLASTSRLPKPMTVPPGFAREDVSVTLNLYTTQLGPDAKFVLIDRKWRKLAEVKGRVKNLPSPDCVAIVEENGTTEILKLRPYVENQNMEQFGHIVALFYVLDDPTASKECSSTVSSNP